MPMSCADRRKPAGGHNDLAAAVEADSGITTSRDPITARGPVQTDRSEISWRASPHRTHPLLGQVGKSVRRAGIAALTRRSSGPARSSWPGCGTSTARPSSCFGLPVSTGTNECGVSPAGPSVTGVGWRPNAWEPIRIAGPQPIGGVLHGVQVRQVVPNLVPQPVPGGLGSRPDGLPDSTSAIAHTAAWSPQLRLDHRGGMRDPPVDSHPG